MLPGQRKCRLVPSIILTRYWPSEFRQSPRPLERTSRVSSLSFFFFFFLFFNLDFHDSLYYAGTNRIYVWRDVNKLEHGEHRTKSARTLLLQLVRCSYRRLDCTFVLSFAISFMNLNIYIYIYIAGKACSHNPRRISLSLSLSLPPPFILVEVSPRQGRGAHSSWERILPLQVLQRLLAVIQ